MPDEAVDPRGNQPVSVGRLNVTAELFPEGQPRRAADREARQDQGTPAQRPGAAPGPTVDQ